MTGCAGGGVCNIGGVGWLFIFPLTYIVLAYYSKRIIYCI